MYPAPDQLETARVFAWWSRAVPARIRRNAAPVRVDRGTLFVHVTSPAWANELTFLADELLQRIRDRVPEAGVRRLRFRTGPLPSFPEPPPSPPKKPKRRPVSLTALPDELGRALAAVRDDDLRAIITRAATTSLTHAAEEEA